MPFARPATLTTVLPLAVGVMLIDGYDLQVMALLVPVLAQHWGVTPADFGWVLAAPLLGLGVGAAGLGPLGDRYGRRPVILIGIAALIAAVLLSALAPAMLVLGLARFFTGVALGATLPNVTALVAETAPESSRSAAMTFISVGIAVGGIIAGLLVPVILEAHDWRATYFASAAVSALFWLALWWKLPESPNLARAKAADRPQRSSYVRLFDGEGRRRTPLYWMLYCAAAFTLYLMVSWLPTLLTAQGWSVKDASRAIAVFQTGGLAGGLGIAFLMDRWRPDHSLLLALALAAVAILLMSLANAGQFTMLALIALVGGAITGVMMVLPALGPFIYPPDLFSTGLGVTVAVGRIGAIAAPLAGGALLRFGMAPAHIILAVIPALFICVLATILLRVHGHKGGKHAPR